MSIRTSEFAPVDEQIGLSFTGFGSVTNATAFDFAIVSSELGREPLLEAEDDRER